MSPPFPNPLFPRYNECPGYLGVWGTINYFCMILESQPRRSTLARHMPFQVPAMHLSGEVPGLSLPFPGLCCPSLWLDTAVASRII